MTAIRAQVRSMLIEKLPGELRGKESGEMPTRFRERETKAASKKALIDVADKKGPAGRRPLQADWWAKKQAALSNAAESTVCASQNACDARHELRRSSTRSSVAILGRILPRDGL